MHWCPTSDFAFLPLHAAGVYVHDVECCSDYVVSSYTPTVTILLEARRGVQPVRTSDAKVFLVAEANAPDVEPLDSVSDEVGTIRVSLPPGTVVGIGDASDERSVTRATVQAVLDGLPDATVLHLACHGQQDPGDPLQSGFLLHDGRLTVRHLMGARLPRAFLAFLSACETAKGDGAHADQAVHLAAAMLFVGFRSVIGTMWCVARPYVY